MSSRLYIIAAWVVIGTWIVGTNAVKAEERAHRSARDLSSFESPTIDDRAVLLGTRPSQEQSVANTERKPNEVEGRAAGMSKSSQRAEARGQYEDESAGRPNPNASVEPAGRDTRMLNVIVGMLVLFLVVAFLLTFFFLRRQLSFYHQRLEQFERNIQSEFSKMKELGQSTKKELERRMPDANDLPIRYTRQEEQQKKTLSHIQSMRELIEIGAIAHAPAASRPNMDVERDAIDRERSRLIGQKAEQDERDKRIREDLEMVRKQRESVEHDRLEIQRQAQELDQTKAKLREERDRNNDRQREAEARLEESKRLLAEAETERKEVVDAKTRLTELEGRLTEWRANHWPPLFREGGALSEWRGVLEARATSGSVAATLACLAIGKYRALIDQDDGTELPKALHEVGRYAYQLWNEIGMEVKRQSDVAHEWAKVIEKDLQGRYFIRVAEVGEPKDASWMLYSTGNTPVQKVESWCVQNQRKVAVQKASVS